MPSVIHNATLQTVRDIETGDGGAFFRDMLETYTQDAHARLDALDASLASDDRPSAILAAHSIKGSSYSLGAMAFAEAAGRIESAAKNTATPLSFLVPAARQLRADFAVVEAELIVLAEASKTGE